QAVVLGPHADWRSVRGKLSQTPKHPYPDVAFPRFEHVEDDPSRRPAVLSGELFETIGAGVRSGSGPVEALCPPHPDTALPVCEQMRNPGKRGSFGSGVALYAPVRQAAVQGSIGHSDPQRAPPIFRRGVHLRITIAQPRQPNPYFGEPWCPAGSVVDGI